VRSRGRCGRVDFGYVLPRRSSWLSHSSLFYGITSVFVTYLYRFLCHGKKRHVRSTPSPPTFFLPTMIRDVISSWCLPVPSSRLRRYQESIWLLPTTPFIDRGPNMTLSVIMEDVTVATLGLQSKDEPCTSSDIIICRHLETHLSHVRLHTLASLAAVLSSRILYSYDVIGGLMCSYECHIYQVEAPGCPSGEDPAAPATPFGPFP
jgi:hypothetical protein